MFAAGASYLKTVRDASALSAKLGRGASQTLDVKVTLAETLGESLGAELTVKTFHRDMLIAREDYLISGVEVEPEAGDEIVIVSNSQSRRYQVAQLGDEPEWRWHDRHFLSYRVHVVDVGAALLTADATTVTVDSSLITVDATVF